MKEMIKGIELPGKTIFARIKGSYGHNLQLPTSDVDYGIVYVLPTKEILSLCPIAETFTHTKPDIEAHEVRKFCELLLKGNPSIIEHLFAPKGFPSLTNGPFGVLYCTDSWLILQEHRKDFLSAQVVKQYLGYALSQLHRLENKESLHTTGGQYNTKWAYHMLRLLNDAYDIVCGKEPIIWKEGKERDFLMDVRLGKYTQEEIIEMAKKKIAKVDAKKLWPLLEFGDRDFLNKWLLMVRKAN